MIKPIALVAGEPNSISSEIIFKTWKKRKKHSLLPMLVIGSFDLLNKQKRKLKFNIKIKKVNDDFILSDFKENQMIVYNINYFQNKIFQKISSKSNNYILKCFGVAIKLIKEKKVIGLVNCPVAKEYLFKNKNHGITEYLAKKSDITGKEVMLIYNRKLSVSPLTTHIPLKKVSKKISKINIVNKIKTINKFYLKYLKRKPNIAILGLNPHSFSPLKESEEEKIIKPAIRIIKKLNIKINGPISPDTSFFISKLMKFDVIYGMYHDQVLAPFKTMYGYDAINITLGLPYIRISPDHGVAQNIMGKNLANPKSLIKSLKFFNYLK